jgi:hypothetical protein
MKISDYKITRLSKYLYKVTSKTYVYGGVLFDLEKMRVTWKEQVFVQGETVDTETVTWYLSRCFDQWFYTKDPLSTDGRGLSEHDSDLLDYLVGHHLNEEIAGDI